MPAPPKKAEGKSNGSQDPKKGVDAATQTEILSMNYIPPKVLSSFQLESEAYLSFFYKPHMVFLLVVLCSIIGYAAITKSDDYSDSSFIHNSRVYFIPFLIFLE